MKDPAHPEQSSRDRPVPSDFYLFAEDPGPGEGRRGEASLALADRMQDLGALAFRCTRLEQGERLGYPPGLWAEGWRDPAAPRLPFGARVGGIPWPPAHLAESALIPSGDRAQPRAHVEGRAPPPATPRAERLL